MDETSLGTGRASSILAGHSAARQRYADLTVVLASKLVYQLGAGSRAWGHW